MNAARKSGPQGTRDILLQVKVNETERQEIEYFQRLFGCGTISEYLRQVALGYRQAYRKDLESGDATDEERKEGQQD